MKIIITFTSLVAEKIKWDKAKAMLGCLDLVRIQLNITFYRISVNHHLLNSSP